MICILQPSEMFQEGKVGSTDDHRGLKPYYQEEENSTWSSQQKPKSVSKGTTPAERPWRIEWNPNSIKDITWKPTDNYNPKQLNPSPSKARSTPRISLLTANLLDILLEVSAWSTEHQKESSQTKNEKTKWSYFHMHTIMDILRSWKMQTPLGS